MKVKARPKKPKPVLPPFWIELVPGVGLVLHVDKSAGGRRRAA